MSICSSAFLGFVLDTNKSQDSLDLDLVYVTKRIIIHGVCSGECPYREFHTFESCLLDETIMTALHVERRVCDMVLQSVILAVATNLHCG